MDARRNILVIDDEASVYKSIRWVFAHRYSVKWAQNLTEAVHALKNEDISIVIADLKMGEDGADGADIVAHLRTYFKDVPIIVLSGYLEVFGMQSMLRWGVRSFLTKPFDTKELMSVVEAEIQESDRCKLCMNRIIERPVRFSQLRRLANRIGRNAVRYYRPISVVLGGLVAFLMWLWSEAGLSEWFRK